ncbi:hypothetical protein ACFE35_30565, partial [Phormidesmis priestleyi ANT.L61.2]
AEGDPLVQRRCTLVKGTVRHCPRLHPQARGTGVLRAMIKSCTEVIMSKEWIDDRIDESEPLDSENAQQECLRILVISSREWVTETIHTLHSLKFAEVGAWSNLLPGANPGEVMSILTCYRGR